MPSFPHSDASRAPKTAGLVFCISRWSIWKAVTSPERAVVEGSIRGQAGGAVWAGEAPVMDGLWVLAVFM